MQTLVDSQLGQIQAEHLQRGGMARPQGLERARVIDFLELATEGRATPKLDYEPGVRSSTTGSVEELLDRQLTWPPLEDRAPAGA
jgi:hypothetical protein